MNDETKKNLISALPFLLIGVSITLAFLIADGACFEIPAWRLYLGISFGALAALIIAVVSIAGLIRKIPYWSTTWISVFLIGSLICVNMYFGTQTMKVLRMLIMIMSLIIALSVYAVIAVKSPGSAGLLGMGLSFALTILLFFIATNISHNVIKIGYYSAFLGLAAGIVIYLYNRLEKNRKKMMIFIAMAVNGILVYVFDISMQASGHESQLAYLLFLSVFLLFSGIGVRLFALFIKKLFSKKYSVH